MRAGSLLYRAKILKPRDKSNEFGELHTVWEEEFTCYCNVDFKGGNVSDYNYEMLPSESITLIFRDYVPIDVRDRVEFEKDVYQVENVILDRAKAQIRCSLTRVND